MNFDEKNALAAELDDFLNAIRQSRAAGTVVDPKVSGEQGLKALQLADASKVVPIDKLSIVITMVLAAAILQETFTPKSMAGCVLITAGTLLMVL